MSDLKNVNKFRPTRRAKQAISVARMPVLSICVGVVLRWRTITGPTVIIL